MIETITEILRAIERCRPKTVHIFCHPDDHRRVKDTLGLLPVRVIAHRVVPAGRLWVAEGVSELGWP